MSSASASDKYLTPVEQPVFQLDSKSSFEKLTPQEKKYAHFMSQASWWGSLACFDQVSVESPALFRIFQNLFGKNKVADLQANAEKQGVSKEDFSHLLQFSAAFYGNMGNYLSFGDTKFVPRISQEKFQKVLESSVDGPHKDEALKLFNEHGSTIYSLESKVLALGLEDNGVSTYYSANITAADIGKVRTFMQNKGISPYNTRLFKHGENDYEIKLASSLKKDEEKHQHNDCTIRVTFGDYQEHMKLCAGYLEAALPHAANENQVQMLKKYIDHFQGGSIEDHKDSQRHWIKDIGPVVETNIGFIESYRDPEGERGEFEGLVATVNKEMSAKFSALVDNATKFIPELPWSKEFEKDKFLKPDFTSLEVLTFSGSGVPAGINIPNYDDIRQNEGFKNVSLGNVIAAKSPEAPEFIQESDRELYSALETHAFEVQVGIHELLGHGTGKLFIENEKGEFNFPRDLKNPITGEPIKSWYKNGETWDSKFSASASTMEECRAECCGIYLCTNKELLSVFGYNGEEADNIYYVNWLIMVRAGVRALEFYTPETQKWGQAHMQARFAILRVLLAAGEDFVKIHQTEDNAHITVDREKIKTVGMKAIGGFLLKLQVYKSTADAGNGIKFYTDLTSVDADLLKLREIVLLKKKPRRVFVQPHTYIENDEVKYQDFPATVEGVIESFITRFKC